MKKLNLIAVALFGAAAFAAPSVAAEPPELLPSPVLTVGPDGEPLVDATASLEAELAAPWEGPVLLAFLDAPPNRFESEALDRLARWYPIEIVRADRSTRARADALLWRVDRFPTFVVADFSPRDAREVDRWTSFLEVERR
ncbi:MAG: hypothetical protein J6K25_04390, partial [Thermoguttaceae bacterium]|nr:hypothetical protein [Thermoguttaceae bacterium]